MAPRMTIQKENTPKGLLECNINHYSIKNLAKTKDDILKAKNSFKHFLSIKGL
jgi:hypothetical protein